MFIRWGSEKRDPATAHWRVSEKLLVHLEEKIAAVTEVMGNKNAIPPKGPDTGTTQKEEGVCINSATGKILFSILFYMTVLCFLCLYTSGNVAFPAVSANVDGNNAMKYTPC